MEFRAPGATWAHNTYCSLVKTRSGAGGGSWPPVARGLLPALCRAPPHPPTPGPWPARGGQWRSGWGQQGVRCAERRCCVGTPCGPEDRDMQPQAHRLPPRLPTRPWAPPGVGGAAGWGPDNSPTAADGRTSVPGHLTLHMGNGAPEVAARAGHEPGPPPPGGAAGRGCGSHLKGSVGSLASHTSA